MGVETHIMWYPKRSKGIMSKRSGGFCAMFRCERVCLKMRPALKPCNSWIYKALMLSGAFLVDLYARFKNFPIPTLRQTPDVQ